MKRKQTKEEVIASLDHKRSSLNVERAINSLGVWAKDLICERAASEGYRNAQAPNAPHVFEFICDHLTGPYQHPFGEVITKLLRFTKSEDPEDLAKAVAWIVLVYRHHINKGGSV